MVDFQSRDTRQRGATDAPEEASDEEKEEEEGADTAAGGDSSTETASERPTGREETGLAVVTVAAGRSVEADEAGAAVVEELEAVGGTVVTREVIRPAYDGVQSTVDSLVGRGDVDGVVTVGGTGVEPTDVTVEAVRPMFAKELPGFGELLRRGCEPEIGPSIIRTRATAGVIDGVVCFCLPGETVLARRATSDIVAPEAEALASLTAQPEDED